MKESLFSLIERENSSLSQVELELTRDDLENLLERKGDATYRLKKNPKIKCRANQEKGVVEGVPDGRTLYYKLEKTSHTFPLGILFLPSHPNLAHELVFRHRNEILSLFSNLPQKTLASTPRLYRGNLSLWCDRILSAMAGLKALHDADIVHRDVKPDNISLHRSDEDEAEEIKLFDFEFACEAGEDEDDTSSDHALGTSHFMDLCYYSYTHKERSDLTPARDIFALGMTLLDRATDCHLPSLQKSACGGLRGDRDKVEHMLSSTVRLNMERWPFLADLICDTIVRETSKRPTIDEVISRLTEFRGNVL